MKKIFIYLVMILFFVPIVTIAETKTDVEIRAIKYIKTGDTVKVDFSSTFKGVSYPPERKDNQIETTGVYMFAFQIDFDESVFEITNIVSEYDLFNVGVYKSNNKYYVVGELSGNKNISYCPNGVSLCSAANVTLDFKVKDTDKKTSNIKVTNLEGALITYDGTSEFTENNIKAVEEKLNVVHIFEIKKDNSTTQNNTKSESIIEEKKVNITNEVKKETSTIKKKVETNKNNTNNNEKQEDNSNSEYNNYLKKLEIEGYEIGFNKHIAIYEISVDKDVNFLKVIAEPESNKSTFEIKGADNLKESNDKVTIIVTSGKKETKTYIVNIKRIEREENEKVNFILNITDDQKKMAIIFTCCVVGIGLIIFIGIKIRDRRIEKNINKW